MLAEGLGMKLEIQKVEWDGLIAGVMTDKFDAIIAGMTRPRNAGSRSILQLTTMPLSSS